MVPQGDTICSGDLAEFIITSVSKPIWPVRFDYSVVIDNPDSVTVTYLTDSIGFYKNDLVTNRIVNNSDEAQRIRFIVTPYTVTGAGLVRCTGMADTVEFWVEPLARVGLTPKFDTICNDTRVFIDLSSVSQPTRPVRFRYSIVAPPEVVVVSGPNTNLTVNDNITDSLHNTSNFDQLVLFVVTPYTRYSNSDVERCAGRSDTAYIWLEPTARVHFGHYADTICNNLNFDSIFIQSVTFPTVDVRFNYEIVPDNPLQVSFTYSQPVTNISRDSRVSEILENLSDTIQRVVVRISPYLIDGNGNTAAAAYPIR